jgi:hypothetical protein
MFVLKDYSQLGIEYGCLRTESQDKFWKEVLDEENLPESQE